MKGRRYSAQHLRCRNKTKCGRRFKGIAGITKCPHCGGESRACHWAAKKPWNDKLCGCDGTTWGTGDTQHREGSPGCIGRPVPTVGTGVDPEYGF